MPFDPISAGTAAAGMVLDFIKTQQARQDAAKNQQLQMENMFDALKNIQGGRQQSLTAAGGLQLDQYGNATYYDPQQGRWVTTYSPTQQRIIDEGQARQGRAQARGAQASEDYGRLRGEYLYRQPEDENQIRSEIAQLLSQARGTSEQQINQLMNRFNMRTQGNIVSLTPNETGPSYGQDLAEMMLKARSSALDESIKRKQAHQSEYLPALKQFEETANYVAPQDQTGGSIVGLQQAGQKNLLSSMSDYDKIVAAIYNQGGQNANYAASNAQRAATGGPKSSDFLNLAKMLMPTPEKTTGTLGGTKGATYSADDSSGIGNWDRRYTFGPSTKGVGTEAAPIGGPSIADYLAAKEADPYNFTPQQSINDRFGDWTFN